MSITDIIDVIDLELDYMEGHLGELNGVGGIYGVDPEVVPDLVRSVEKLREIIKGPQPGPEKSEVLL